MALTAPTSSQTDAVTTATPAGLDVERSYRACVRITRQEAANFYYGISLLPAAKRRAMSAVYAFSRRVDDVGDGTLPDVAKLSALAAERDRLALLRAGEVDPDDPVLIALADAQPRFGLPLGALESLIEGVELDVRGMSYETFDDLVVYCRHVAGSIGRLCLAIFGAADRATANPLADDLGVAMQLTNILRDVREDSERGRVYLPAEDLGRFGISDPLRAPTAAVEQLIRFEAARNREWFDRGLELARLLDSRSGACLLAMTGIYRAILTRIEERPAEVLEHRISVPAREKAWLAARSFARVGMGVTIGRRLPSANGTGGGNTNRAEPPGRGRVVVVGGGLAGIAAALDCAAGGARVTLLEARPRLGGAAYSVHRNGLHVDNGQHVFLRCCTEYRELLDRMGATGGVILQDRLEIPVVAPGTDPVWLRRDSVPPPAHLARSLVGFRLLSVRERVAAGIAMRALDRLDTNDPANDERSFGEWLARHHQSERAIDRLWGLIARPTLNLMPADASLAQAAYVFQTGLLRDRAAGDVGWARVPLSDLHDVAARRTLLNAGVDVRSRIRVERVTPTGHGDLCVEIGGRPALHADAVIVAVQHDRVARLVPALGGIAAGLRELGASPIVNVHVVYDRRVLELPFVAAIDSPVQWVFDRTAGAGLASGQYLAVSLSAADEEALMTVEDLRSRFVGALSELLPAARTAKVEQFFVIREHAATFRASPGARAKRPGPRTSVPGLLLAGAFTDTGWPATMEGAVRSGRAAATEALSQLGAAEWVGARSDGAVA